MTEIKAAPYWKAIGRTLGFTLAELEAITNERACHSDKDCYSSMIRKWLNWAPPNHDIATLQALISAMRNIHVHELERLAFNLENNFA